MEIIIIGTGNVATVLGRKLKKAGHIIVQVCGRNRQAADALAAELQASACYDMRDVTDAGAFYLIALADDALKDIGQTLQLPGKLVAHTAGAVSKDVLKKVSANYGIFYPLQSLRKEMTLTPEMPVFIDAANDDSNNKLHALARTISNNVNNATDEQRTQLHLAAVMVNNFTNHLYLLAEKYCQQHGLDFKLLLPLIKETANRLDQYAPEDVQTGPAVRNDMITIQKHMDMLDYDPSLKALYKLMTESITSGS
jgi:predicted short-subunit dehydrogenase-like oxidoreductase (DUF2520 family)